MTDRITQAVFLEARMAARAAINEYHDTSDDYIRALEDELARLCEELEQARAAIDYAINSPTISIAVAARIIAIADGWDDSEAAEAAKDGES